MLWTLFTCIVEGVGFGIGVALINVVTGLFKRREK